MLCDGFEISASAFIHHAYCRDCHNELAEVPNGFLGRAMFCPSCETVYTLKLIKVPDKKITSEFVEQCRESVARNAP